MKDVRIEYSIEATINTGNFENVKPGYKASATLDEGEDRNAAAAKLTKYVESLLERKVDEIQADLASQ